MTALPTAMLAFVQDTLPLVAPTAGLEQAKPPVGLTETKLHPPAMASVIVTLPALGPLLVTVMLKVTSVSGAAVAGPDFRTVKSLTCADSSGATAHTTSEQTKNRSNVRAFMDPDASLYMVSPAEATRNIYLCHCVRERDVIASLRVSDRLVRDRAVVDVHALGQPRILDGPGEAGRGELT